MLKGLIVSSLWSLQEKIIVSDNNLEGAQCPIWDCIILCRTWRLQSLVEYLKAERTLNSKGSVLIVPEVLEVRRSLWKREALFHPLCQSYYINHHGPLPGFGSPRPDFQRDQAPKVPAELSSSGKQTHYSWPDKIISLVWEKIYFIFLLTLASPNRKLYSKFSSTWDLKSHSPITAFLWGKNEKQLIHQTKHPLALRERDRNKKVTTNCLVTICLMLAGWSENIYAFFC